MLLKTPTYSFLLFWPHFCIIMLDQLKALDPKETRIGERMGSMKLDEEKNTGITAYPNKQEDAKTL